MNTSSDRELAQAQEFLKAGNPEQARIVLENALTKDLENEEILFSLRCTNFWSDKFSKTSVLPTFFERGENLISQWRQFMAYLGQDANLHEKTMYAVKKGVFTTALENYQQLNNEHGNSQNAEIFRKMGLCYKKLGVYEDALKNLGEANSLVSDSAPVLAEMADCYALCGSERTAKLLFREAFYLDAQKIDLSLLDSELIGCLVNQVQSLGYTKSELLEWIPVYGVLFGVFSVKRELRALEVGKLKQSIYALENDIRDEGSDKALLVPRLINHYFWLIDHHVTVHDERSKINEILLKIKLLDIDVYSQYTK